MSTWIAVLGRIEKVNDEMVTALKLCLRSPDPLVVDKAMTILQNWLQAGNEVFVVAFKEFDAFLCLQGLSALERSEYGNNKTVSVVEGCLWHSDSQVKAKALAILMRWAAHNNEAAISRIAEMLRELDIPARLQGLAALKESNSSSHQAVHIVKHFLRDSDHAVRKEALAVLLKWAGHRNDAATLMIVGMLKEGDRDLRLQCLLALKESNRNVRAVPNIAFCLQDADPQIKTETVGVLGKWAGNGNEAAAVVVANILKIEDSAQRLQVLLTLKEREHGSSQFIAAIQTCLEDADGCVQQEAKGVLERWERWSIKMGFEGEFGDRHYRAFLAGRMGHRLIRSERLSEEKHEAEHEQGTITLFPEEKQNLESLQTPPANVGFFPISPRVASAVPTLEPGDVSNSRLGSIENSQGQDSQIVVETVNEIEQRDQPSLVASNTTNFFNNRSVSVSPLSGPPYLYTAVPSNNNRNESSQEKASGMCGCHCTIL